MGFSIRNLVRNRDALGHPIGVFYKGSDKYQTVPGGCCSMAVMTLVLVMFVISIAEVFMMEEPMITSYEHPLSKNDRQELGDVSLSDYNTVIGFNFWVVNPVGDWTPM